MSARFARLACVVPVDTNGDVFAAMAEALAELSGEGRCLRFEISREVRDDLDRQVLAEQKAGLVKLVLVDDPDPPGMSYRGVPIEVLDC